MIQHETHLLDPNQIKVVRDKRQRKSIDEIDDLKESIARLGQLQPIIVDRSSSELVAGERRLAACKSLDIPVRVWYADDLNSIELKIVELEENAKRKDLTWQENVMAVAEIHEYYTKLNGETWTQLQTAEQLGLTDATVSKYIKAASEINPANPRVMAAKSISQASNIISRQEDRKLSAALDDIGDSLFEDMPEAKPPKEIEPIVVADFNSWAPLWAGPKFNFIHCDFPYGINHHETDQGNQTQVESYQDDPETFWTLCETLLSQQDRIMSDSAHLMFWFDMAQYDPVYKFLRRMDLSVFPIPLVWHKSDNKGIISDPQRRARHIYEVAFYAVRGDRKVVQVVSDLYPCPTVKDDSHISIKPEPMLRHFFRAFVDDSTKFLDPTCGSGSSLRAAESLKATVSLGLERDASFAEWANRELLAFRNKRKMEELTKGKTDA